jgi:hypothetical protein
MENTMDEKHTAYPVAGSLTEQERHSIEAFYQDRIPVPAIAAATHNLSVPVRLKRRTRLNSAKREIAQVA